MNNQSSDFNQENHSIPEKPLEDSKIWEMQEEIEFLREQVESLKQVLCHEHQRTEEYIQELAHANQELEWMNQEISNLMASNMLPVDEAEEFPKSVVQHKKSITKAVAELVNTTNSSPVQVNKSEQTELSSVRSKIPKLRTQYSEIRAKSDKLRADASQITSQADKITARSREIRVYSYKAIVNSREVRNRLGSAEVSSNASHKPALSPMGTAPA